MTREEDIRDARRMPLHLLRDPVYLATFAADDAPEFSVVCLASDSMSAVLERARKYPGWVEIVVHDRSERRGDATVVNARTRQVLPRQFDPEHAELHDRITIGRAFEMLLQLETAGWDIFRRSQKLSPEETVFARELVAASRPGPPSTSP